MNAQAKEVERNAELVVVENALVSMSKVDAGLAALKQKFGAIVFDCKTPDGLKAAKLARNEVREPRLELERIREGAKAPVLALGRKIDGEAARIKKALLEIEEPIAAQIKAEEDRIEAERQAKIAAEQKRVGDIAVRIGEIRSAAALVGRQVLSAESIAHHIKDIESVAIDESFAEFQAGAQTAKEETLATLRQHHAAAVAREAEAERLRQEREELARQRAEQEARDKIEREAREAAETEQRRKRDAEIAAENARLADERRKFEDEQRAARERQAAEDRRIADERAALERQQREEREARERRDREEREAAEAKAKAEREAEERRKHEAFVPTLDDIIEVLASHYQRDRHVVSKWLADLTA